MGEWEDRLATGYRADNIPSSKLPESMPPVRPVQPTYPIETRYASDPHGAQYAPPDPAQYTPCMGRQVVAQEGANRELRLAAAILATGIAQWSAWEKAGDDDYRMMAADRFAAAIIAADPTIVCPDHADHELAAAVREWVNDETITSNELASRVINAVLEDKP